MHKKHASLIALQIILSVTIVILFNQYLRDNRPDIQERLIPQPIAEEEQKEARTLNELSYQENLTQGQEALNNHRYKDALNFFQQANQKDRFAIDPFIGVANTFLELDKLDPAKANLNSASQLGNFNTRANNTLTKFYILNRQIDKAAEIYNNTNPKNSETELLGTIINILQPNLENAKIKINQIITSTESQQYTSKKEQEILETSKKLLEDITLYETFIDSPQSYLLTLTGQSLININELSLSRRLLFEAIKQKQDYRDAWLYLGYSYLVGDNLEEAQKTLTKAKEIDPYNAETHLYLGLANLGLGNHNQSIRNLEQASGFGYQPSYMIQQYLGHNYYKTGKFDQAHNAYEQVIKENQASLETYLRNNWILIEYKKDLPKAIQNAQSATSKYPNNAMSHNLAGWSYLANNQFDQAIESLEKALQLNNKLPAAYLNLGVIYKQQNRKDLSLENLQQAYNLGLQQNEQSIADRAKQEIDNINSN